MIKPIYKITSDIYDVYGSFKGYMDAIEVRDEDEALDYWYYEELPSNINYMYELMGRDTSVRITGMLGLWYGDRKIIPTTDTLSNAISRCLRNSDDYTIEIFKKSIKITAKHHNGVNQFKLIVQE